MAKFKVAVQWLMVDDLEIEADTLDEAKAKVSNGEAVTNGLPDGDYLSDSLEVNEQVTAELN